MKKNLTILMLLLLAFSVKSQSPISAIDTSSAPAASSLTYTSGDTTYNWGVSPNNSVLSLNGFTSEDTSYSYAGFLPGKVVLRRVNNARVSGNFSLEWVKATATNSKTYNIFSAYQSNLDSFLNSNTYNKGTDNLFDNTATNSNNIERLDWILNSGYLASQPARVGFAVFDKGSLATHDPFVIAAITSVDLSGNPLTYGNVLRVVPGDYGDPGPSITYRIVKGSYGTNLLNAGTATQSLGGVFISLDDLGVAAGTTIYGYSLFANDLPSTATSANLLDFTNTTFFPLNTIGAAGGLDLVAVTGLFISNTILPVGFTNFSAVENNNIVNLNWAVENESSVQYYDVERSEDGINYLKVGEASPAANSNSGHYSQADGVASVTSNQLYYRIKQYAKDGSYSYSKVIVIKRDKMASSIIIYPNPVKSNLNLKINNTINDKAIINVFNSAGVKVIHQQATLANGNNSFTIDGVNKLPKGIYQLSIKRMSSGNIVTKQFTKQ